MLLANSALIGMPAPQMKATSTRSISAIRYLLCAVF